MKWNIEWDNNLLIDVLLQNIPISEFYFKLFLIEAEKNVYGANAHKSEWDDVRCRFSNHDLDHEEWEYFHSDNTRWKSKLQYILHKNR